MINHRAARSTGEAPTRHVRIAVATAVLVVAGAGAGFPTTASAATSARHFANCTAMHRVHRGGVARPGAHDKRESGQAEFEPKVSRALYDANQTSDRDHDGIACEH